MVAVDTNILVRFLVQDDAEQFQRAKKLLTHHDVYIPDTVMLETEWVLRFAYGLSPDAILQGFLNLLGMENVHVRDAFAVKLALDWFGQQNMDFADAWHLALSQHCGRFATFDDKLIKRAKSKSSCQPFTP
ncbi:MAG: type II toxin-antitoxin system VapC family toxin [Thiothrix sp.]|jgi:predicted nucleic-acid-binding protein|uniref:type II toxin-antitoxin system VapC family toxin n=1 Tax=Thiothrix sp. TaxID=1032 RepID=UPI0026395894|nr:type II toxin-antitoxin system VapC family toxin [Thiothrix sp.]MDD5394452.1 type II toxin-antitoxin system VapC family toxin [Thiothrix sp.]